MTEKEQAELEKLREEFNDFRVTATGQIGEINGKLTLLINMQQQNQQQRPAGDGGAKVATSAFKMVEKIVMALIGAVAGAVTAYFAGRG